MLKKIICKPEYRWLISFVRKYLKIDLYTYITNLIQEDLKRYDDNIIDYYRSGKDRGVQPITFDDVKPRAVKPKPKRNRRKPDARPYKYKNKKQIQKELRETKDKLKKVSAENKQNKHESNVNDSLYHHYKRKCEEQLEIINGMSKNIDLLQSKLDDIKTDNTL